eukprot:scaffold65312_cov33-Tisochrysis_lutea.AAC.1
MARVLTPLLDHFIDSQGCARFKGAQTLPCCRGCADRINFVCGLPSYLAPDNFDTTRPRDKDGEAAACGPPHAREAKGGLFPECMTGGDDKQLLRAVLEAVAQHGCDDCSAMPPPLILRMHREEEELREASARVCCPARWRYMPMYPNSDTSSRFGEAQSEAEARGTHRSPCSVAVEAGGGEEAVDEAPVMRSAAVGLAKAAEQDLACFLACSRR